MHFPVPRRGLDRDAAGDVVVCAARAWVAIFMSFMNNAALVQALSHGVYSTGVVRQAAGPAGALGRAARGIVWIVKSAVTRGTVAFSGQYAATIWQTTCVQNRIGGAVGCAA